MENLLAHASPLPGQRGRFAFVKQDEFKDVKPYYYSGELPRDQEHLRTNIVYSPDCEVLIQDVRQLKDRITLQDHGIEYIEATWDLSAELIDKLFLPKHLERAAFFLKEKLEADLVLAYDYRVQSPYYSPQNLAVLIFWFKFRSSIRKRSSGTSGRESRSDEPANTPHIGILHLTERHLLNYPDQTTKGGLRRINRHLTSDEAAKYLDGSWRLQILNLWQPLNQVVRKWPLAWCDPATIAEKDIVAADRVSQEYIGEVYYLINRAEHRWYFLSNQSPNEMALFLSFDSDPCGGPLYCPHASFADVNDDGNRSTRESLEIRFIVARSKNQ